MPVESSPAPGAAPVTASGPLSGVRVVEVANYVAGPHASGILADLGADVLKIETPSGDPFRAFSATNAMSPYFAAYNRNKRSAVLDIVHSAEARVTARQLVAEADVFVHNLRPSAITRVGLDYEAVAASNHRLIYCAITGPGPGSSPAGGGERPAYDTVGQALSGLLGQLLDPDSPRLRGPAFSDLLSGMAAANSILAALYSRSLSGVGQKVEVSMVAATASILASEYVTYFRNDEEPQPRDRPAASQAFIFKCSDERYVTVHLSSPEKFWRGFVAAVDMPELADDPRFASRRDRVIRYEELNQVLSERFLQRTQRQWIQELDARGVPYAPLREVGEAALDEDPSLRVPTMTLEDASGQRWTSVAPPASFSGTPVGRLGPPPLLGQHTDEIVPSSDEP